MIKEWVLKLGSAGPIVRIAPNMFTFDDPNATSIIYGSRPIFRKGKFYSIFQPPGKQYENIYSSSDNRYADQIRGKYKPAYDALSTYESSFDEVTALFISKLTELNEKREEVDIGWWLKCFATDANGKITV